MLITEWKTEKAKEVWQREAAEKGRKEAKEEDAKNFLALGVSPATVAKATGLDLKIIKGLSEQ